MDEQIAGFIEEMGDLLRHSADVHSAVIRSDEDPPSATWHVAVAGKEYLVILQPTDLAPVEER